MRRTQWRNRAGSQKHPLPVKLHLSRITYSHSLCCVMALVPRILRATGMIPRALSWIHGITARRWFTALLDS